MRSDGRHCLCICCRASGDNACLDRSVLLLHVFDLEDEAAFIEHFKHTYERPLMEIFE